jgi:hypothetical protein
MSFQPTAAIVIADPGQAPAHERTAMFRKAKQFSLWIAAIAGAAVGGAAIAGAATSNTSTAATGKPAGVPRPPMNMPAPGSSSHEDAEKAVTGADAAKAQAAAVKAAGGGTAGDVTTTYFGGGYEVTVTQSDGSSAEYHLDSNFQVMHGPPGGFGGPPPGGPHA